MTTVSRGGMWGLCVVVVGVGVVSGLALAIAVVLKVWQYVSIRYTMVYTVYISLVLQCNTCDVFVTHLTNRTL
jgi:hypothetical protein